MLFRSNDTATTDIYTIQHTLSLHDALPIFVLASAAATTLAAWAVFSRLEPMHVQIGLSRVDTTVPLGYQLSVFPAFGAFVGALVLDVTRREEKRTWWARALLVGLLGMLAGERGALLALRHFGGQFYEATPAQMPAHASDDRTSDVAGHGPRA